MAVNLSRKARVFITSNDLSVTTPVFTAANTFELQILNDWSFSQTTNATTVEMMEAGPTPKRGQRTFNHSMNTSKQAPQVLVFYYTILHLLLYCETPHAFSQSPRYVS